MNLRRSPKLFGVALDASDDPFSLQLKLASIWAREQGRRLHEDPYEALLQYVSARPGLIEPAGKFPVPSWLGPRPQSRDYWLVTQERVQKFLDDNGPLRTANAVKDFVAGQILPGLPIMVGIDHSVTGGVLSALSEALGPEKLTVLVLDRHFDALPLSVRMGPFLGTASAQSAEARHLLLGMSREDGYCCGNFWAYLIDTGVVKPENLLFVGVADYPAATVAPEWETFRDRYMSFEERGCSFFPLREFEKPYNKRLEHFLHDKIRTPYLYVSLDLDVAAYRSVHAARYMDGPGIDGKALQQIARLAAKGCRSGAFKLAGLDVMEFNMHLLGITTDEGIEDQTVATAFNFIHTLIADGRCDVTPSKRRRRATTRRNKLKR